MPVCQTPSRSSAPPSASIKRGLQAEGYDELRSSVDRITGI